MNYSQIAILFLQGALVAFAILLLFRLRRRLGIGVLFACLGLFQFVQVFLTSTVYVSITNNFFVSPGSAVFFTASLFALLIIYIKEDASETRKIIYALLIVNIVMAILLQTLGWNLEEVSTHNPFNVSTGLFNISVWVLIVGTIALFLDSLLIIVLFEFISKRVPFLFLQICLTMLIVVSFDTVFFSIFAFSNFEILNSIIISGLISKGVFAIFYSILFYVYLKYFDLKERESTFLKTKDVFKLLTFKQKFETAESEIKKAEEMYRILTDHSTDLICLHEPDSTFKYISPSIKNLLGYDPSEFLGKQVFEILHNDDIKPLQDAIQQKVFSSGVVVDIIFSRVRHKDGRFIWLEFVISPVFNEGEISYFVSAGRDITERVVANEKIKNSIDLLEKSEYSLTKASRMAKIGYWEYDSITDLLTWSDYVYRIYGLDPKDEALTREEMLVFFDRESKKKLLKVNSDLDSMGIPYDIELKLINRRKEEIWLRTIVQPMYNDNNEVIGRRGVLQDITLSKLRQEELDHKTEKLFELNNALNAAQELAHVGSWFHDFSNNKSEWSEETFRIWGFDSNKPAPDEDAILSRIHKDDLETFKTATELVFSEGASYDIEYRICLDNEEVKMIRSICKPIFGADGEMVSLNGVNQDITQQKRRQNELDIKSEKLHELNVALNQAQKLSNVGSWEWNMATDEAEWSDEMYNIYGVTKENFYPSNESVMKTVLPEDLHKIEKGLGSLLIDKMFVPFEFRIKRPSGEIRNLYIMALEKKSQENVFGVTKDITERKIIEEENLKVKNNYRSLFDNATISIWNEDFTQVFKEIEKLRKLNIPNIKIYLEQNPEVLLSLLSKVIVNSVNKATLKLFKAKSNKDFFNNIHNTFGEDADKVFIKLIESIWNNKKSFTSEVNYKKLNGDEFVALFSIPIPQTEEEQKIIPISIQNIQSIKDAESAERASIKDLNAAQELAQVGSWFFNVLTKESDWSDETYRIWGFDLNEIIPNEDLILNRIHIDDREMFLNAAELVYNKRAPYDIEYRICLPNDKEKWIRSICRPILDDTGKVVFLKGTNQDITEKKRATDEIEKAEELYRLLTDNSNDIICLQEPDSTFKYMSPSIKKVLGYEPSEFIGKQVFNILHNDDVQPLKDAIEQKVFSIEASVDVYSFRVRHKDGHLVWLEYLTSPVYIENEISYFVTSARDITQRVEANEIIKTSLDLLGKSERSKNEASKIAKIGYWEYNIATDTFTWSDYLYQIYGLDLKDEIPTQIKILSLYDKESQEKIAQAIQGIDLNNSSFDLELKFTNLKNEEVWERSVIQAVYNDKNEVVGRRGIMQDITDSKNAQFELERSKKEIESSLLLLEKKEYSLSQTSNIAKIGYWEYDIATDLFTWSEYVYYVYGLNLKDKIPSRKEMVAFYDKESQEKLARATLDLDLDGIPYDIELKVINLRNEAVWVRNVVQPVYGSKNKVVGRRGVIQDITDSKNAQFELEVSRQEIEISLNMLEKSEYSKNEASKIAKIGYLEDDIATDTFIWSDYLYHIFGFDPKEKVPSRKEIAALFDKESQEKMADATLELDLKGVPFDLELKLINLRNEEVWARIVNQPVYNDKNEIVGRRGVFQDITASKKAQLELELSKQEIETSLSELEKSEYTKNEASKIAEIGYHEYDIAADVFIWSEYLYDIFGFDKTKRIPPREEILPLFDKESQKKMKQATLDLDFKGIPYDLELKITNLKNEVVWVRNIAEPVYNENNELIGRRGVTQNITSSKKAQLDLELSKEDIQTSLELLEKSEYSKNEASKIAKIGYHEYDIATDTFIWSDYVYFIFGFDKKSGAPSREEVVKLFDAESQKRIKKATLNLDLRGVSSDLELRLINLKMKPVWIRIIAQPVYNDQNVIIGRRGIIQDITVSKEAQLALETSKLKITTSLDLLAEKKFSMDEASKVAKLGYHEYDIVTDVYIWSDYVYNIYGIDLNEPVRSLKEIILFYDKESQIILTNSILELDTKGISFDIELKLFNPKNEEVWVRNVVQPIYNDKNEIVGRRGVMQDITERKKIEEEHLRIKDNYRRLFENATISIWNENLTQVFKEIDKLKKLDIPDIKVYFEEHPDVLFSLLEKVKVNAVNKATLELFKAKDYQQFVGKIQNTFGKGAYKVFGNLLVSIWNNEKTFTSEVNFKTLEGEEFIALFSVSIPQTELEQKSVPASIQSIQSIKDAELEKRRSIKKLKEAEKLANVGSWVFNISTQESNWSEEMFNIWGFDLSKHAPELDTIISRIHKDDLELFNNAIDKSNTYGTPYDIEFRILLLNKEQKWIRSICQPVLGSNGKSVSLVGSNQDITEWVLARQEIQKYQTSLQQMTTEMTLIEEKQKKDIASNIHDHLSQSLVISKMKINEMKKKSDLKIINEDLKFIESHISEALENSRKITYELSPPVLYQLGIIDALNWLLENVETTHNVKCVVNSNVNSIKLSDANSILLYRCIQEVIKNAVKYANASLLTLNLDKNKLGINIVLMDNGGGFDTSTLNDYQNHSRSGFGLFAVRERVKNIQGEFTITSEINKGTSVKIFIPLAI